MKQYKNTGVWLASSSATAKALEAKDSKLADRTFRETTERFEKQFPNKEDRDWFMAMSKGVKPESIEL
jgi:hypothetical protein